LDRDSGNFIVPSFKMGSQEVELRFHGVHTIDTLFLHKRIQVQPVDLIIPSYDMT
jgi:hypothetical protein